MLCRFPWGHLLQERSPKSVVRLVQSWFCSVAVLHHLEPSRQNPFIKAYTVKFSDCYRKAEVGTEP